MTPQIWVAEKITHILAKTSNTIAKKLKVDLKKDYLIKMNCTTMWKEKNKGKMKELYGDWANTSHVFAIARKSPK
jgi:hypothetical protein